MFKGYIPTKGKKPTEKIRGRTDFYKLDDVKNLKEYGGVLDDPYIMIDIDDSKEADILFNIVKDLKLKCNTIKTSRGMHFYFKNTDVRRNAVGKTCALGITVDIKLGSKNAVVPLKINNKEREIKLLKEVDELPRWLQVVEKIPDFFNLEEGDGRNQVFFNYILKLQKYNFTKDEIKEAIRIINKYILKNPLEDKELKIILRNEAFQKPNFYDGNKLMHDKFATFLKCECNLIKIDNILHIYKDGIYINDLNEIEKAMIQFIPTLTKSKRTEILSYLDLICENKNLSDPNYLVLNNGLLDIKDMSLKDFEPTYICKNRAPVNYNPTAYNETMDKTLDKICCNDKSLRSLIEEMVGYCLFRRNELGKAFILTGEGSNGKSTLLSIIKAICGHENVASIGLDELCQRFKTAELYGKLTNIGDDISNNYIADNSTFKKLVTGETVNVERKGRDPFDFTNYSKLIFSANEIPRINDTSNGLMRRLVIVPFNATFSSSDKDFDPFIKDKLLSDESLEYLLRISIDALKRILAHRKFTTVAAVENSIKEYEKINNPILTFMDENKLENESTKELYLKYSSWCSESGLKALSRIQFSREICKRGYKTKRVRVEGKIIRIFVTDVTDK